MRTHLDTFSPVTIGAVLLVMAVGLMGCGKGYRELVIIDAAGRAQYRAVLEGGGVPPNHEVFAPGRIVLFRTIAPISLGGKTVSGLPGHIYRVNDRLELEHVGEFDATQSDQALLQKYAK